MQYYKVEAKCGHVGRNNYIKKMFYVYAADKKEAAQVVRWMPRVKHHHKDAIFSVEEITCEEYREGRQRRFEDPFFRARSQADRDLLPAFENGDIQKESPRQKKRKAIDYERRNKIEKINKQEWVREWRFAYEY